MTTRTTTRGDFNNQRDILRRVRRSGALGTGLALPACSDGYAVVKVNDAVWESALIEKFELHADVVGQGALAASDHDRA